MENWKWKEKREMEKKIGFVSSSVAFKYVLFSCNQCESLSKIVKNKIKLSYVNILKGLKRRKGTIDIIIEAEWFETIEISESSRIFNDSVFSRFVSSNNWKYNRRESNLQW